MSAFTLVFLCLVAGACLGVLTMCLMFVASGGCRCEDDE